MLTHFHGSIHAREDWMDYKAGMGEYAALHAVQFQVHTREERMPKFLDVGV